MTWTRVVAVELGKKKKKTKPIRELISIELTTDGCVGLCVITRWATLRDLINATVTSESITMSALATDRAKVMGLGKLVLSHVALLSPGHSGLDQG